MASICILPPYSAEAHQLRWVGDPVDVVTGMLADTVVDVTLAADPPILWQRRYSSALIDQKGPFGRGSDLGLARSLRITVDGILYTRPCSQDLMFPYPLSGQAYFRQRGHRLEFSPQGLSRVTGPEGAVDEFTPMPEDPPSSRLSKIVDNTGHLGLHYDARGHVIRITAGDTRALHIEWHGDQVERLWTAPTSASKPLTLIHYTYDEHHRLREILDRYGARQTFNYDGAHRLVERSDRSGYRFEYAYDDEGRCISARGHDGVAAVQLRYMPEAQATLVTLADGGEWLYRYDESASITEIINPLGGKRSFSYHEDGRLDTETDASSETRRALYGPTGELIGWRNSAGALRPASSPSGPLPHRVPRTHCELEVGHHAAQVTSNAPCASASIRSLFLQGGSIWSRLFATPDPRGEHSCHRDITGLLLREDDQDAERRGHARVWGYTANGWVERYRDHDGGRYEFKYSSWNHRIAAGDPLGRTIRYEYTPTEKIASITDPAGNRHEYGYDLTGELTSVDHAGERVETYFRDQAGRLIEKRDAAGKRLITYEYGASNLKSRQQLASGEDYRYQYTPAGQIAAINDSQRLYEFAYTGEGRRRQDLRGGRGIRHRFSFEERLETTILDRFTIRYEHTDEGRFTIIDPTGGRHLVEFGTDGSVYRHFACGHTELSHFNSLGRCLGKHLFPPDPKNAVWRRRFEYSAEGDLVAVDDSELGTTLYSYDAAHQLVGELGPEGRAGAYAYDLAGNLVQAPGLSDVAIGHGNQLLTANGDRFTYDGRNNLSTWESDERTLHFIRDSLDRLRVIEGLDRPWTAEYDPLGRRIRKTYGSDSTEYFWDTDFLTAERHADGRLRIFVRADDFSLVPWLVLDYSSEHAEPTDGRVHTILSDPRGAPIAALDSTGTRIWSASYSPYGSATTRGDLALPQRLAGQHCDLETGLYYHRFRYYSPVLGRFLEEDPAGVSGGLGLYSYTSSPLVDFDPRGLKCDECDSNDHKTEDCPETKKNTRGGGKNDKHANVDARRVAEKKWQAAKAELQAAKVSGATKRVKRTLQKKIDHWKRKMDFTGENHSTKDKR